MQKIKKISQRLQTGAFSDFYPIGADSVNIDMLSGSNLEEEMHLGSPSETSFNIDENTGKINIVEKYKKNEDQTIEYYIMETNFETENNIMTIIQKLKFVKNNNQIELKKIKTTTFNNLNGDLEIKEVIE